MRTTFLSLGALLISIGAILHVYFFVLESLTWREPKTWRTFGLPNQEHAEIIAPMAFNQGFYNLFLAIGAVFGLIVLPSRHVLGATLAIFAAACMTGAGMVLYFSVKRSRKAALIQAVPPLVGLILLSIGLSL